MQTNLVRTRTQGPHRDGDRTVSVSCGGTGWQWFAAGTGALGTGMAYVLLEEVTINPTVELPELTQDWEIDSWRAQTKPCVYQDPGERSSDPTGD